MVEIALKKHIRKVLEFKAESITNLEKMDPKNVENRGLERGLGALGGDLGKKNLSKAVLLDFGQPRIVHNLAQMGEDGAKLEPSWSQDNSSWGQDGHLEAIWGAILSILGGLGGDL